MLPFNISIFFQSEKGSKDMYKTMNEKYITFSAKEKWENHLNMTDINWKKINPSCTKYTRSTKLCWFLSIPSILPVPSQGYDSWFTFV